MIPGRGRIERLAYLVGRARALETIIGSDGYDASTAQELGHVNRAVPDADLDGFVDAFARRAASFDRRPIATAKRLIDRSTLPETGHPLESQAQFGAALTWPEPQKRVAKLFERGLQQRGDFELRFGHNLGGVFEEPTVD